MFVQGIGLLGLATMIGSYQCKSSKKFFFVQMMSYISFMAQFVLLGALTGAGSLFISASRNFLLYNAGKRWADWKGWQYVVIVAYIVVCMVTWKNYYSILPAIAMVSGTVAAWTRNGKIIRLNTMLVNSPCWLTYDFISRSYAGVIGESFSICSILISFWRFGFKALDGTGEEEPAEKK